MFAHAALLRTWGGIVDVCPDASPIIDRAPVDGVFLNCGWGTGGFKATPASGWVYAETIATGQPSVLARPFSLDRFTSGALIDEHGAAAVAH
jgi:sarcosine oxidase subunit beta